MRCSWGSRISPTSTGGETDFERVEYRRDERSERKAVLPPLTAHRSLPHLATPAPDA